MLKIFEMLVFVMVILLDRVDDRIDVGEWLLDVVVC